MNSSYIQTYTHNSDIKEFQAVLVSCQVNASLDLYASLVIGVMGLSMKELAGGILTLMAGIGTRGWDLVVKDLIVCDCFWQQQR